MCEVRLNELDSKKGRAGYQWGTPWELKSVRTDNDSDDPPELVRFVKKWRDLIQMIPTRHTYFVCPIKWPWEIFVYKGIEYNFSPSDFDCNDQFFEHMMIHYIEDALIALGAEKVFCTAMMD